MCGKLPTIEKWGETYYIDSKLGELRNVKNSWDVVSINNCSDQEEFASIMMTDQMIRAYEDIELNRWG